MRKKKLLTARKAQRLMRLSARLDLDFASSEGRELLARLRAHSIRHAVVIERYYGLGSREPESFVQIGATLGLSEGRISQLRDAAMHMLQKLRASNAHSTETERALSMGMYEFFLSSERLAQVGISWRIAWSFYCCLANRFMPKERAAATFPVRAALALASPALLAREPDIGPDTVSAALHILATAGVTKEMWEALCTARH